MFDKFRSCTIAGVTLTAALLWSTATAAAPQGSLRYSVVVDKFDNNSNNSQVGYDWATLLTSALHESGSFIVVAQDDMQLKVLKEQLRSLTGFTTQGRKTAQRGQMIPAQLMVKGVITHVQQDTANQDGGVGVGRFRVNAGRAKTEVRATLQMIDTTTGALVAAKNFVGMAQKRGFSVGGQEGNLSMGADVNLHAALEKAIEEVIPWMVEQLPSVAWRGTVVRVDKDRIIINRGSREGVTNGDEFVAGESEILRDPDTGEVLDEVLNERARIKVVKLNDRTSVCTIVNGDAGQIVTGMAIQYSREKS